MPRNSQGLYTLPLPPVVPNTLIESEWANRTMEDIEIALTGSLPRNGSAPMTGPLTLSGDPIIQARQAVTKEYVDRFVAYATGIPIAAIIPYAGATLPSGWLLCDGAEVLRSAYPDLFNAIGTVYGTPLSSLSFKLPDLRNEFVRGVGGTRVLGSKQASAVESHTHGYTDPTHTHRLESTQTGHTHSFTATTTDAGAADGTASLGNPGDFGGVVSTTGVFTGGNANPNRPQGTAGSTTYSDLSMSIPSHSHTVDGVTQPANSNIGGYLVASGTGIAILPNAGAETVPQNIAMNYFIKAINDTSGGGGGGGGGGTTAQRFLGFFDASSGQLPQIVYPTFEYVTGDEYIISVGGTLLVYDPVTQIGTSTTVVEGDSIIWIGIGSTMTSGWYLVHAAAGVPDIINTSITFINNNGLARQYGNYSDPVPSKRPLVQTTNTTTAGYTSFGIIPGPVGTRSEFVAYSLPDADNSAYIGLGSVGDLGQEAVEITSGQTGTAVVKPIVFRMAGNPMVGIGVDGNFIVGLTDTNQARRAIDITNQFGTAVMHLTTARSGMTVTAYTESVRDQTGLTTINNVNATDKRTVISFDHTPAVVFEPTVVGFAGAIIAAGDITAFSDERLKTNWGLLPKDFVLRLSQVVSGTFTRKDTGTRHVGVSAQSLQALLPEAVKADEDGMLSVAYGNAALTACVALAKEVELIKARVQQLEGLVQP